MAEPVAIDDPGDQRLADYIGLTDAALRRRIEHGRGLFIAEGELVIRQLLSSPYPVRSVLLTPTRHRHLASELAGVDAPVFVAPPAVLQAVAGFNLHRGAVAAASRLPPGDAMTLLVRSRTVAVLEGLNDHENVGALFRNAAALGVDAVLLAPGCADPLYRRAVRVSMGGVLRVPFATVSPWPGALAEVARAGFELVALTPRPEAEPITEFTTTKAVALLVGSEARGLSAGALDAADRWIRIPMRSGVDSINVAAAAAIAFHHIFVS